MPVFRDHESLRKKDDIDENAIHGNDFLQLALDDDKIVGYIRAERGKSMLVNGALVDEFYMAKII